MIERTGEFQRVEFLFPFDPHINGDAMKQKKVTLSSLADMVKGEVAGDGDILIHGFSPLDTAADGEVSFLVKANMAETLLKSNASAFIVPMKVVECEKPLIRVRDPYVAAAIIHTFLLEKPFVAHGIHKSAVIGINCDISEQITIGPLAVIGNRVSIGERVSIRPGVVLGDDVTIGDDTILNANVTVEKGCIIGHHVTIHSGTVIGSDGYGYAADTNGCHIKRPQVGIVQIDDDVEIGANTCIDRAAYGVTWIKKGAKIDNLVQVAHNVVVGENSLLVAQVGLSGSTTMGRNVVLGGKASTSGHLHLDDGVMVAAKGGVHTSLAKGTVVAGTPAIPIKKWLKATAIYARLPEIWKEFKGLKRDMKVLQEKVNKEERVEERSA